MTGGQLIVECLVRHGVDVVFGIPGAHTISIYDALYRHFRAHGLIAKIPRTRRWRVTVYPRRVMGTALYLRNHDFSRAYIRVAA